MGAPDQHEPSAILGDPDGLHWAAYAPDGGRIIPVETEVLDVTVSGEVIRFMWDYGVQVPLWDREGLLPEEPEWLHKALLLSDDLITDLVAWGDHMNRLDGEPSLRTDGTWAEMNRQGRVLASRLQAEVGSRYAIEYKPW